MSLVTDAFTSFFQKQQRTLIYKEGVEVRGIDGQKMDSTSNGNDLVRG
jgi:hypothetical protein